MPRVCWRVFAGRCPDACSQAKSLPAPDPVWKKHRFIADAAAVDSRKTRGKSRGQRALHSKRRGRRVFSESANAGTLENCPALQLGGAFCGFVTGFVPERPDINYSKARVCGANAHLPARQPRRTEFHPPVPAFLQYRRRTRPLPKSSACRPLRRFCGVGTVCLPQPPGRLLSCRNVLPGWRLAFWPRVTSTGDWWGTRFLLRYGCVRRLVLRRVCDKPGVVSGLSLS